MLGGVAAFYKSIDLESYSNVEYFYIQNDSDRSRPLLKILTFPLKYISYIFKCIKVQTVVINPSFDRNSFFRDALYLFIAKNILQKRTIVFWHGWDGAFERKVRNSRIYKFLLKSQFGSVNITITLGRIFKNKLLDLGLSPDHQFVISTVAAEDVYLKNFSIAEKFKSNNTYTLLFLSRVIVEKGIFVALEIMNQLVNINKMKNLFLIVSGEGKELQQAKNIVIEKQLQAFVRFTGYIHGEEKSRILYSSHILLFPTSFGEGMPVSILESMLYGLYIMTSDKGAISDVIDDRNGDIYDPTYPDVFANRIRQLVKDINRLEKVGLYNHAVAKKMYTSTVVKERLYQLINNNG